MFCALLLSFFYYAHTINISIINKKLNQIFFRDYCIFLLFFYYNIAVINIGAG